VSIEEITVIRERDEKFGEMEESEDDEKAFEEVWRCRCGGSRVHV
jgi:CDGSH-type Zn-finger protein